MADNAVEGPAARGQSHTNSSAAQAANQPPQIKLNGEVVIGDVEYDGRVILYIIKGTSRHIGGMPLA